LLAVALTGDFRPPEVRRQVAAAVRAAHFQRRELVERPVEDQPREKHGRLERVADDVTETAATGERSLLDQVPRAVGMHERQLAELSYLGPEHVELRRREALAVDVPADGDAARAEALH